MSGEISLVQAVLVGRMGHAADLLENHCPKDPVAFLREVSATLSNLTCNEVQASQLRALRSLPEAEAGVLLAGLLDVQRNRGRAQGVEAAARVAENPLREGYGRKAVAAAIRRLGI